MKSLTLSKRSALRAASPRFAETADPAGDLVSLPCICNDATTTSGGQSHLARRCIASG